MGGRFYEPAYGGCWYYDRSLKLPPSPEILDRGGVHDGSLKRQEIPKWNWQMTPSVWEKKMRTVHREGVHFGIFCRLRERSCTPPHVQNFREKAVLNCGRNIPLLSLSGCANR